MAQCDNATEPYAGGAKSRERETVDFITRTSHYERSTMSGTGYNATEPHLLILGEGW